MSGFPPSGPHAKATWLPSGEKVGSRSSPGWAVSGTTVTSWSGSGAVLLMRHRAAPPIRSTTAAVGTRTFQSFLPATGGLATFTALAEGDGASAGEEPDAGDGSWATKVS